MAALTIFEQRRFAFNLISEDRAAFALQNSCLDLRAQLLNSLGHALYGMAYLPPSVFSMSSSPCLRHCLTASMFAN